METPFVYDKYITGKYFLGRKKECSVMANLLAAREHISLYEPPKTGKMSLIRQTLINMRLKALQQKIICSTLTLTHSLTIGLYMS